MRVRNLVFVAVAALAAAMPARAALILEMIQVPAINSPVSSNAALSTANPFVLTAGQTGFIQVCLTDTVGAGPNAGQPNTPGFPWETNAGNAGPGSFGVSLFFLKFFSDNTSVAFNPGPTASTANARLLDQINFGPLSAGSNPPPGTPPNFTRYGGAVNFGSEPGLVPDPAHNNRMGLFTLKITAAAAGSTMFHLADPNPGTGVDMTTLANSDLGGSPNPGTTSGFDAAVFGPGFNLTYDIGVNIVAVPEPSSMALCGLAFAGIGYRKLRRKNAKVTV